MSEPRWPPVKTAAADMWRRGLVFMVMVGLFYLGGIAVAAVVRIREFSALARLTGHDVAPGGRFQSLRRFREAEAAGKVDVVFLGSSHAYRGFDPRLFAAGERRAFNLGSTNQTPLNGHYLAERYLPQLRPALVVVELYPHNLDHDGLESSRDLLVNTRFHPSQLRMAIATRQLGAFHYAVAKGLGLTPDLDAVGQRPIAGENYVTGGYCETKHGRTELFKGQARVTVGLSAQQRSHLLELTVLAKAQGAQVVWVTHPLPSDHLALIDGLPALRDALQKAAHEAGVDYWDFNQRLTLDPRADFMDFHHLNQRGVTRFNEALLEALEKGGYWPP